MKKLTLIGEAARRLEISEHQLRIFLKKTGYGYESKGESRSWFALDEKDMSRATFYRRIAALGIDIPQK